MIRVYLVRHGIAADGSPDEFRALTDKGRRRFRRAARAFARLGEKVDVIYTSPLVRAVQTAEILANALKASGVAVLQELGSGASPRDVIAALTSVKESVALVGHEPQMSGLIAALTGTRERLDVRKGSIIRIDCDALPPKSAECKWWLKPKSRTLGTGLPKLRTA